MRFVATALLTGMFSVVCAQPPSDDEQRANEELRRAVERDPRSVKNLESLTRLSLKEATATSDPAERQQKAKETRELAHRLLSLDPNSVYALYALGAIVYVESSAETNDLRAEMNRRAGPSIDEAIDHLRRAIEHDAGNRDAMMYLSLLLRERALLRANPDDTDRDVTEAAAWKIRARGQAAVPGGVSSIPSGPQNVMLAPPPPPPPAYRPPAPQRIRVGGNVPAANIIRHVEPAYPQLARQARVQGTVRFNAIIGKDGAVANLQFVSGHPLLVQAAQDAVRQWLYKPTLLNGEPVESGDAD